MMSSGVTVANRWIPCAIKKNLCRIIYSGNVLIRSLKQVELDVLPRVSDNTGLGESSSSRRVHKASFIYCRVEQRER